MSKPATQSGKINLISAVAEFFVKGLGLGRIPFMPGTWGSLLGIVFVYILSKSTSDLETQAIVTLFLCAVSWLLIAIYEKNSHKHDDQQVVLDEVAGIFVCFLGIPISWPSLFVGFILFRFFDILKPFPISWADRKIPGAFGTLFDDLLAGFAAGAFLHGLMWGGWL